MGNVMTPFSLPTETKFINRTVNLLASEANQAPSGGGFAFYYFITDDQAKNDTFYISGTATAALAFATIRIAFFALPSTAPTKIYTFNVGNVTIDTGLTYGLSIVTGSVDAVAFDPSTTFQAVYSASGYGSSGIATIRQLSATNIPFATT